MIASLGLDTCRHVRIGDNLDRGISGQFFDNASLKSSVQSDCGSTVSVSMGSAVLQYKASVRWRSKGCCIVRQLSVCAGQEDPASG